MALATKTFVWGMVNGEENHFPTSLALMLRNWYNGQGK